MQFISLIMKYKTFIAITTAIILSILPIILLITTPTGIAQYRIVYNYIPPLYFKLGIILGFVFIVLVAFESLTLDATYFYPLQIKQQVKISGLHKRISSMLKNQNYAELGKILYRNFRRTLTESLRINYSSSDEEIIRNAMIKFPSANIEKMSFLLKIGNDIFNDKIVIGNEQTLISHHIETEDFLQKLGVWKYGSV